MNLSVLALVWIAELPAPRSISVWANEGFSGRLLIEQRLSEAGLTVHWNSVRFQLDPVLTQSTEQMSEAAELIKRAQAAAFDLKYPTARVQYDAACRLLLQGIAAAVDSSASAKCLADAAAVVWDAGEPKNAAELLRSALAIAPALELDPRFYQPGFVQLTGQIRKSILTGPRIKLEVRGSSEATAWLDGRKIGALPAHLEASDGDHVVVVKQLGHLLAVHRLRLSGSPPPIDVRLQPLPFEATIAGRGLEQLRARRDPAAELQQLQGPAPGGAVALLSDTPSLRMATAVNGHYSAIIDAPTLAAMANELAAQTRRKVAAVAITTSAKTTSLHPIAAMLPLGIGQFLEGRPLAGSLFLIGELGMAALGAASYVVLTREVQSDGGFFDPTRARVLQITNIGGFAASGVIAVGGAIDGLLHRQREQ